MKKNDGGQAFPTPDVFFPSGTLYKDAIPGMSLRDHFAAVALAGILFYKESFNWTTQLRAAAAYRMADAMIAEREKE